MNPLRIDLPHLNRNDVEILERLTAFQGYFRIDRYTVRHRLFGGDWSGPVVREVFERGHSVAILPYDPAADAVVLIEQFRAGALAANIGPWVIECPAGIIGDGEAPDAVARRETMEETGCTLGRLESIARFLYSPGGCSETCAMFAGEIDSSKAAGIHGLESESEDIKIHVVPADEAIGWIDAGGVDNAALLIALLWLARHRDSLRARWLPPQLASGNFS